MANEELLHGEDVIFNKPSLKELIRLIKNGTINAIWPSTQQEFDWWNETGRYLYQNIRDPEILRLKSLKTAMTIYYGDNTDLTTSSSIDIDATNQKWLKTLEDINKEKQLLVDNNYYNEIDEIYPNQSLLLDENSINSKGMIENSNNVIAYKENILSLYKSYLDKIIEFKNRVKNYISTDYTISYTLSNPELFHGENNLYQAYFNNYENQINNFISSIPVPSQTITEEEILNILISNEKYNFDKVAELYNNDRSHINEIIALIGKYYLNDNNISQLSQYANDHYIATGPLDTLQSNYINEKNLLERDISLFNLDWETESHKGLQVIQNITIPLVDKNNIDIVEQEAYAENLELFYENFLYPYQDLFIDKYCLQKESIKQEEALAAWNELVQNTKNQINNIEEKTFDFLVFIINQTYYNINSISVKEYLTYSINNIINFLPNGTIENYEKILTDLSFLMDLIDIIQEIIKKYSPANEELMDLNKLKNYQTSIKTQIENLVTIDENTGKNKIQTDQEVIINNIQTAKNIFYNFIQYLKTLSFVSVEHPTEDNIQYIINEQDQTIEGLGNYTNTISEQQKKIKEYYDMLLIAGVDFNDIDYEGILDNETINIINKINNLYVDISRQGTEEEFYEKVIASDFTEAVMRNLLLKMTQNQIEYDENLMIPKPSADYLSIENSTAIISTLDAIIAEEERLERLTYLTEKINKINNFLNTWYPVYEQLTNNHYICIAVGSDIKFNNEISYPQGQDRNVGLNQNQIDGSITMIVDEEYHYPLINNLATADTIGTNTRNSQILTVGGLATLFGGNSTEGSITSKNVGNTYIPMYIYKGVFTPCNNVISGNFSNTTTKGNTTYWDVVQYNGTQAVSVGLQAKKLFGAVYNDYAEYRSAIAQPGQCVIENGDGSLSPSTRRLQLGANIVSDTYGFAIGETNDATCPIAVSGRVLALPLEDTAQYTPGAAVCSGPNGTISLMTREEIREWPDAIVGYVSEIPTYDAWGSDNVPVNGRIWIKIK